MSLVTLLLSRRAQVRCLPGLLQAAPLSQNGKPRRFDPLATKKVFEQRKAKLKLKKAEVKAKVEQAKNLVNEQIGIYRENIMTIPNLLCVGRIACTPLLGYWVVTGVYPSALCLFAVAGLTDMLDGQIARRFPSQKSMAGSLLDPLADKLLLGTLFLTLTYVDLIPLPLTGLIIARDVSLVATAFYLRFKSLPSPRTLVRYFDPSIASMNFEPTLISKANTVLQLGLVGLSLAAPVFDYIGHPLLLGVCWLTAGTTLATAVDYLLRKDTYKFVSKRETKSKM